MTNVLQINYANTKISCVKFVSDACEDDEEFEQIEGTTDD